MSYDLTVYGRRPVDEAGVVALLAADPELAAADEWRALRGAEYAFHWSPAEPLEPEDVPAELEPLLPGARWRHGLTVEGSGAGGIAAALRFAPLLAAAADGAVYDGQEGITLGADPGVVHRPQVPPDERVDVVELRWYARRTDRPPDLAERWLAACREHLPAALPRRFGPGEPLRHKLDRDGDAGLVAALAATDLLFGVGSRPVHGVALPGGAPAGWHGPVDVASLTVERSVAGPELVELFVALTGATGAFFASAQVLRGMVRERRGLYSGAGSEHGRYLAPGGNWCGLPPEPVAWTWFGPAYARLVDLPGSRPAGGGLLHRWPGTAPAADEIDAPVPWTRADLLAVPGEGGVGPAPRIPGRSWWSRLTGR